MNYIGKKSLSSVLAVVVTILWWAEWLFGVGCIGAALITANVRKMFALQVPISFEPISIHKMEAYVDAHKVGILNTTNGTLSIHIDATWQNMALMLVGYGALFAVIVTITYQIKQIFKSFKQDEPFQKSNLFRIRLIALILIAYSIFQWLFVIVTNQILLSKFIFHHLDLTYDFNVSCLVTGIVMLVLEGIFKMGVTLEEDKQLTI